MSEQTLQRIGRTVNVQTAIPWLAAMAVYTLLIVLGSRLLADPDTYSHIALGRWILQHHAVPVSDPLSETMRGTPWIAFEWLSQVAYATAYALGGWLAVVALAATATATAFGLLARFLLRHWQPLPTLVALLAALVLLAPHILARPHILALPVMVAWVAALVRASDDKRAPSWWLLPLMVLWANLHGSFSFGLAIVVPIGCEAVWTATAAERSRVAWHWIVFGLMAVAAACLNPYGPEMILVTFRTIALGQALTTITEWQPQNFGHLGSYELIMLGGFALALYRGIKLPPLRILMLLGLVHLSLAQERNSDLLAVLAPILLARPLAGALGDRIAHRMVQDLRIGAWLPAIAALIVAGVTGFATINNIAPPVRITPAAALKSVDLAKDGPILNDYDFGGYLDFVGIHPFIDGRSELYGRRFILRYTRALNLVSIPDFLRLLRQYRIGVTLLAPNTPAVALLDRLPQWRRVYADKIAVVHVHHGAYAPGKN